MKKQNDWKYAGGTGVWTEFKNIKTGESTIGSLGKLSEIPDSTNFNCDHYWELLDPHESSIQCQKCRLGKTIIWGIQILRDGKLIQNG
jgi:hypothetical protein